MANGNRIYFSKSNEKRNNPANQIAFCPDHIDESHSEWPLPGVSLDEIKTYQDLTEDSIRELIQKGILRDDGILYQDPEEPKIFVKDIKNIWLK